MRGRRARRGNEVCAIATYACVSGSGNPVVAIGVRIAAARRGYVPTQARPGNAGISGTVNPVGTRIGVVIGVSTDASSANVIRTGVGVGAVDRRVLAHSGDARVRSAGVRVVTLSNRITAIGNGGVHADVPDALVRRTGQPVSAIGNGVAAASDRWMNAFTADASVGSANIMIVAVGR